MLKLGENRAEVHTFLNCCFNNNLPFYAFQLPFSEEIQVGIQTSGILQSFEHLSELEDENGFVFSPFDLNSRHKCWFIRKDLELKVSEISLESIRLFEGVKTNLTKTHFTSSLSEGSNESYFEQITLMIEDLKAQKLDKVILSRIQLLNGLGREEAVDAFLKLTQTYDSAFVFFVSIPEVGTWIGASPETLLSVNHDGIETVALAGTQKLDNTSLNSVLWGKKEIQEQAFVSSFIESVLQKHQINTFEKIGPTTAQAGNVVHLKTLYRLSRNMEFNQIANLIHDLHPTPAVCGLPRHKAMELIREVEQHDREYYAGYLGPIHKDGTLSLFVNLRSMRVLENQMALFVGGGITADSIPEKEWEETCFKAQTILNVIT